MKKLPDAEFEVMQAVWRITPPVTTALLMEKLEGKNWKAQTLLTLLSRLVERGFLKTGKQGRERIYYPLVTEEDYLRFETVRFVEHYHNSSLVSLISTLYGGKRLSESEEKELRKLLNKRGE